jgi:hypothetical protein
MATMQKERLRPLTEAARRELVAVAEGQTFAEAAPWLPTSPLILLPSAFR